MDGGVIEIQQQLGIKAISDRIAFMYGQNFGL